MRPWCTDVSFHQLRTGRRTLRCNASSTAITAIGHRTNVCPGVWNSHRRILRPMSCMDSLFVCNSCMASSLIPARCPIAELRSQPVRFLLNEPLSERKGYQLIGTRWVIPNSSPLGDVGMACEGPLGADMLVRIQKCRAPRWRRRRTRQQNPQIFPFGIVAFVLNCRTRCEISLTAAPQSAAGPCLSGQSRCVRRRARLVICPVAPPGLL